MYPNILLLRIIYSHISRKHRGVNFEREARMAATTDGLIRFSRGRDGDGSTDLDDDSMELGNKEGNELSNIASSLGCPVSNDKLYRSAALFLLSVKELFHLTQTALNFIIQRVQQIVSFVVYDTADLNAKFKNICNPFLCLQKEHLKDEI